MEHIKLYKNDSQQSITKFIIDEQEVYIGWWYSTKDQVTEDELNDFLLVKALLQLDRDHEAKAIITNGASGSITTNEVEQDGFVYTETIDTRNQRQKWLDSIFN
jgi:hypothetical protein